VVAIFVPSMTMGASGRPRRAAAATMRAASSRRWPADLRGAQP
jgi:hypothetical protein